MVDSIALQGLANLMGSQQPVNRDLELARDIASERPKNLLGAIANVWANRRVSDIEQQHVDTTNGG